MPFINGDGHFTGPNAVVANIFMQLYVPYDGSDVSVKEIFGEGDKVAMVDCGYHGHHALIRFTFFKIREGLKNE